ncbi:Uncharacterised protein [Leminorella richardii]|uniref:Uncharacterized protein n=1 Tax=Leminorella richardii TaxID=158841 RepID=A0A2X4XYG1_9GAMM|nr:hypothetical protein [Leminorella richardii]SQI41614.1 Uncharacterised protein [Leminorella richardii]
MVTVMSEKSSSASMTLCAVYQQLHNATLLAALQGMDEVNQSHMVSQRLEKDMEPLLCQRV